MWKFLLLRLNKAVLGADINLAHSGFWWRFGQWLLERAQGVGVTGGVAVCEVDEH